MLMFLVSYPSWLNILQRYFPLLFRGRNSAQCKHHDQGEKDPFAHFVSSWRSLERLVEVASLRADVSSGSKREAQGRLCQPDLSLESLRDLLSDGHRRALPLIGMTHGPS